MVRITFVAASGEAHSVDGIVDYSVMEAAVKNGVPGIAADCGGACACATCRVFVDAEWRSKTGEPSEMESEMLEAYDVTEDGARLSCQIKITAALDGLVVRMPESQHL